jgi:DNA-3-methyladenine glycosylase
MGRSDEERPAVADASQCGGWSAAVPHPTAGALPSEAERPLPQEFFARPAERVAPDLVGCLLVRRLQEGGHVWGMVVETEAYCQSEEACHGHRRRTASNDTLFGPPARFYVYLTYGLHHCVNVVTHREDWANGVLLRAVALPAEPERVAAGPALLARRYGIDRSHDRLPADPAAGLWLASRPAALQRWWRAREAAGEPPLLAAPRVGISQATDLPWRWYLRASRSVSRRARGDRAPKPERALRLEALS